MLAIFEIQIFFYFTVFLLIYLKNVHYGPLNWFNDPIMSCDAHFPKFLQFLKLIYLRSNRMMQKLALKPYFFTPSLINLIPFIPWEFYVAIENLFCKKTGHLFIWYNVFRKSSRMMLIFNLSVLHQYSFFFHLSA